MGDDGNVPVVVKFELLADLDTVRAGETVSFDSCRELGAVNLRGTGFAAVAPNVVKLQAVVDGAVRRVEVNIAPVAGFLLAKTAAAYSRRKSKDWYDIAFVLLHNDLGGVAVAADAVRRRSGHLSQQTCKARCRISVPTLRQLIAKVLRPMPSSY